MDIGIIGAGEIGGSLTRRLSKLGHKVWKIAELPEDLFDGIGPDIVVVDTGDYCPWEHDGRIDDIETGRAESRWVANQLGRPGASR
ncbi:TPA: NAD(P)-binding domain-containing protein [Stenotrophomonas maltophilia]